MKRIYILFVISFFISATAKAQVYGNEWINYSQKYLKIKVPVDGIYRIDSTTISNSLNAIGIPLSTIDPRNLQLFHDGHEEFIWVTGEADGIFNNGDMLEFFGKHNDGLPDSSLYTNGNVLLNPYFSLFNDTAIYFLTWNSSLNNLRLTNPNDTAFASYAPAPYFIDKEKYFGNSTYFPGVQNILGMTDPSFISSEGFYDYPFGYGSSAVRNISTMNAFVGGPNVSIRMKIGSHSDDWNLFGNDNEVKIEMFNQVLTDTTYNGFQVNNYSYNVSPTLLGVTNTTFSIASINPGNASQSSGLTAVAYIALDYAHTFDMEGRTFFTGYLPDNTLLPKSLIQMTNISGSGVVHVYDLFNHQRIDAVNSGPYYKALVANGNGSEKQFVMFDEINTHQVSSLTPVAPSGQFTDYSTFSADSAFVIVTHKSLMSVGQQYKNYRSSAAGGLRNVVLANVDELYDQFAFGIGKDPLSIRHFADFMIHTFPTPPAQLLLIGKSTYGEYYRIYGGIDLVPTFGNPPCDNSLTAGLNGTLWEPAIPTGRIAALDSAQAQWYLNKVIAYESQSPAEWMKYVLHFGGGTTSTEQHQYEGYLNNYKNIIQDTSFGGIVQTYLKTSSAPIQINQSDSLRDRINAGVSMMTFFGHASGTSFDQSIDDPSTYTNVNRYPFLLANSCWAGDIHSPGVSSSEAFTLIDQKGTIAYLGSVGEGIPGYLNIYSTDIYKSVGQVLYGKPIGDCIKWTVHDAELTSPNDLLLKTTLMEMTLEGDPAVVINSFPKPDYEITNADVWFDQTTQPDSITVFAKITNLGKAINDSMIVRLLRTFPSGGHDTLFQKILTPKFRDTIQFSLPIDFQNGIGLNKINICVDWFGQIAEMNESNNCTSPDIDLLIHGSAIVPVYPYEYAVIPTDTITLKACTVNPLEPIKTYRFELDTTDLFNSPFKQTHVVAAPGGVVSWVPNLMPNDSMVYFWRVSPDSLSTADVFIWRQFSFQYITNKVGWGQDHIYQFTKDGYQFVQLDRPTRHFNFVNDIKNISVKNGLYFTGVPWNESWYKINGALQAIFSCTSGFGGNGLTIAVINPATLIPNSYSDSVVQQEPLGYLDCVGNNGGSTPPQVLNAFDFFDSDQTNRDYIKDFLNAIPTGYYVLVYSQDYSNYVRPAYDAALQLAFQSFGCDTIGTGIVSDTVSFIAWGTKGGPAGSAKERIGLNKSSVITLEDTMTTNWNSGFISSPLIGPASNWGSFHWRQHPDELPTNDSVYVQLLGTNNFGVESLLATFPSDSTDINTLLPYVNASTYPYIRLVARMKDDASRTPPQMDRWHVLYTPVPDLAVNPPLNYSFHSDTLQEGENVKLTVAIQNLTPWSFNDSLLLTYWVVDKNRVRHNLPQKLRMPYLFGYNWFTDTIIVPTVGFSGANELWLEANPVGNANTMLEQYHFNNVLMVPFYIGTDRINPLLDVTFDGVHIMDKDIVSGKPGILVTLKDENQFLALNDTSDFKVFLRTPSQSVAVLMPWGPNMTFVPAILPHNSCKILFNPTCFADGIYELLIQAKDRSNNQSGLIDYKISFEVINKPTITNVLNYPNPFTSSTQFVFTLTGTVVPELFTIQIMTITGKVVREINKDELGDIHIGRNITNYAWDGRDDYGDQLANGVYLYRVITKLEGQSIEQRDSGADQYINHGWGKMYLMR